MHTRTCNSAIWIMVGLAILLLMFQTSIGLLAVALPASLILANIGGSPNVVGEPPCQPDARPRKAVA
jgi:hypothetical protein